MNQLSLLTDEQLDERFHIAGRMAVLFSLGSYANHRDQFSVYFNDGQESFLTHLLAASPDKDEFIIDCSGSPEINKLFLRASHGVFVAKPEGIAVQFSAGPARLVDFDGDEAFALPLPRYIVRLQRREYFRICIPRVKPPMLSIQMAEGSRHDFPLHDLSVAGCGLSAAQVPTEFSPGFALPECRFVLPDAGQTEISAAAIVRHETQVSSHSGPHKFRIGLQFLDLGKAMEHRIQRYITHIEHERREHS